MQWEKKICIRLTARRILGAVLTASTVVNLVIVGAAFEAAAPTSTATLTETSLLTTPSGTAASLASTATASETFTPTSIPSASATSTPTDMPTLTLCVLRSDWPVYRVQPGDTLFSLGRAIGSSADELRLANCLPNDQIFPGQLLYMPRLPRSTFMPSFTATETPTATSAPTSITPTITLTYTPITPTVTSTDTPTPTPYLTLN
jgi:LysM repeat protein